MRAKRRTSQDHSARSLAFLRGLRGIYGFIERGGELDRVALEPERRDLDDRPAPRERQTGASRNRGELHLGRGLAKAGARQDHQVGALGGRRRGDHLERRVGAEKEDSPAAFPQRKAEKDEWEVVQVARSA